MNADGLVSGDVPPLMVVSRRCRCGVPTSVSHYCSSLGHCWVSKVPHKNADGADDPPNPHGEHLAPSGKPIDGYPLQQE